mmetsp:Transcript_21503/g.63604  ORF Transcript_21503/g.63604 Transcript_21503/m.63604 type:complete len:234 (+) Transcript_21503:290-991(+)
MRSEPALLARGESSTKSPPLRPPSGLPPSPGSLDARIDSCLLFHRRTRSQFARTIASCTSGCASSTSKRSVLESENIEQYEAARAEVSRCDCCSSALRTWCFLRAFSSSSAVSPKCAPAACSSTTMCIRPSIKSPSSSPVAASKGMSTSTRPACTKNISSASSPSRCHSQSCVAVRTSSASTSPPQAATPASRAAAAFSSSPRSISAFASRLCALTRAGSSRRASAQSSMHES